jgi:hypothetical protein
MKKCSLEKEKIMADVPLNKKLRIAMQILNGLSISIIAFSFAVPNNIHYSITVICGIIAVLSFLILIAN